MNRCVFPISHFAIFPVASISEEVPERTSRHIHRSESCRFRCIYLKISVKDCCAFSSGLFIYFTHSLVSSCSRSLCMLACVCVCVYHPLHDWMERRKSLHARTNPRVVFRVCFYCLVFAVAVAVAVHFFFHFILFFSSFYNIQPELETSARAKWIWWMCPMRRRIAIKNKFVLNTCGRTWLCVCVSLAICRALWNPYNCYYSRHTLWLYDPSSAFEAIVVSGHWPAQSVQPITICS